MRYSVTASEPGARLVLTHGLVCRPHSAAFFASKPAASMTDGFEVFVQLVMAAITTEPCDTWCISWLRVMATRGGRTCDAVAACAAPTAAWAPPSAVKRATAFSGGFGAVLRCKFGSDVAKFSFTWLSGTRSCGRVGPASDGSTVARSSSSVSEYTAAGVAAVRNRPCSLQ